MEILGTIVSLPGSDGPDPSQASESPEQFQPLGKLMTGLLGNQKCHVPLAQIRKVPA